MMFGKKGSLHRLLWLAYQQGRLDERETIYGSDSPAAFASPSMAWWQQAKTGFERFLRDRRPA